MFKVTEILTDVFINGQNVIGKRYIITDLFNRVIDDNNSKGYYKNDAQTKLNEFNNPIEEIVESIKLEPAKIEKEEIVELIKEETVTKKPISKKVIKEEIKKEEE